VKTNKDRAKNAERAVVAYDDVAYDSARAEPQEDTVCDLLCDLRHFCDQHGIDWAETLKRGMWHYECETRIESRSL